MSSCLGLYIENNLIKYAKVSKEHDNIKVDSFGIKFDDNINNAVKQIIKETDSQKTPISINLSDDKYANSNIFSLLKDKDSKKAIETEFSYFCKENYKWIRLEISYIRKSRRKRQNIMFICLYR